MITKIDKNAERKRRHVRVRKTVKGTPERPRLNVYRSTNHIYAQIIDDTKGVTLASASTLEKAVKTEIAGKTKREAAAIVGKIAAERAKERESKRSYSTGAVTFTRGAYRRLRTAHVKPD